MIANSSLNHSPCTLDISLIISVITGQNHKCLIQSQYLVLRLRSEQHRIKQIHRQYRRQPFEYFKENSGRKSSRQIT